MQQPYQTQYSPKTQIGTISSRKQTGVLREHIKTQEAGIIHTYTDAHASYFVVEMRYVRTYLCTIKNN